MEEHDDASLMLAEDDHHHHHHPRHHHDDENDEHEIHHQDDDEDEHMDIEPNRIEGVSAASPAPLDRDDFWDVDPTKEQIWEVGFLSLCADCILSIFDFWVLGFLPFWFLNFQAFFRACLGEKIGLSR